MEKTKAEVREKFADEGYPIRVVGRHINITEPMRAYALEKLERVARFGGRFIDVTIIMDIQKQTHLVDFIINVNNHRIKVFGRSENMYASIDQAIAHLEAKVRRYTAYLHEHHGTGLPALEMQVNRIPRISLLDEINDQIEEVHLQKIEEELRPHEVVRHETRALHTLTQEDAIARMELSEDFFMVYLSQEDKKLKVIYRCKDAHYGIIEVETPHRTTL